MTEFDDGMIVCQVHSNGLFFVRSMNDEHFPMLIVPWPGDSKWPCYLLGWGHLTLQRMTENHPEKGAKNCQGECVFFWLDVSNSSKMRDPREPRESSHSTQLLGLQERLKSIFLVQNSPNKKNNCRSFCYKGIIITITHKRCSFLT